MIVPTYQIRRRIVSHTLGLDILFFMVAVRTIIGNRNLFNVAHRVCRSHDILCNFDVPKIILSDTLCTSEVSYCESNKRRTPAREWNYRVDPKNCLPTAATTRFFTTRIVFYIRTYWLNTTCPGNLVGKLII